MLGTNPAPHVTNPLVARGPRPMSRALMPPIDRHRRFASPASVAWRRDQDRDLTVGAVLVFQVGRVDRYRALPPGVALDTTDLADGDPDGRGAIL
jgi:hypothetical protein